MTDSISSNMMNVSNVSALHRSYAANAFRSAQIQLEPQEVQQDLTSDGLDVKDELPLKDINADEVRQYAKKMGDENLSDDDIKYGLFYGRSVLVNYTA